MKIAKWSIYPLFGVAGIVGLVLWFVAHDPKVREIGEMLAILGAILTVRPEIDWRPEIDGEEEDDDS